MFQSAQFDSLSVSEYDRLFEDLDINTTPLDARARVSANVINCDDFFLVTRVNSGLAIEEIITPNHVYAIQLPDSDLPAIDNYVNHPEGENQSLFASPGDHTLWEIHKHHVLQCVLVNGAKIKDLLSESETQYLSESRSLIRRHEFDKNVLIDHCNSLRLFKKSLTLTRESTIPYSLLEDIVSSVLMSLLDLEKADHIKPSTKSRIKRKAIEYIKFNFHRSISLSDIASYASTSSRNLQIVFQESFDTTPTQMVRFYRYRKLLDNLQDYETVSEAARATGFNHLGRLNGEFKELWGISLKQEREKIANATQRIRIFEGIYL